MVWNGRICLDKLKKGADTKSGMVKRMNEAFEKILERLENIENRLLNESGDIGCTLGITNMSEYSKQIVHEVAEEYNGGWISCSDRLPEDDSICIVTAEYTNNKTMVDYGWFDRKSVCWFIGMQEFRTSNLLAWQPLPEPYKERD